MTPPTDEQPPNPTPDDRAPSAPASGGDGATDNAHDGGGSGWWRGWGDAVRLSVGTLTVLPVGVPSRVDRVVGGRAMVIAPAVGVLVGGIAAVVVALAQLVKPEADLLAAVLGVLVVAGLSGGLHLDGLADFADALGSRRDRETMLRIMKQSDIGPFGVVAIVAVLLLDVAALTACLQAGFGWHASLIATTASRLTLPWSCRTSIPAARPDGLGSFVAATVRPSTAALTTAAVLAATLALTWLTPTPAQHVVRSGDSEAGVVRLIGVAVAVLLAIGTSLIISRRAVRSLGGATGDVLGAAVELALPAVLLTLALTV